MKRACAFFDVDGTVLRLKSLASFEHFYLSQVGTPADRMAFRNTRNELFTRLRREEANRRFFERYESRSPATVTRLAALWNRQLRRYLESELYIVPVLNELRRLRAAGFDPVFVSGSSMEILAPLAADLSVAHVLATKLEVVAGRYTGRIVPPQIIGAGKRSVVEEFANPHDIDLKECHAFGDHISDAPMLMCVGKAHVVAGDAQLEELARIHNWAIVKPDGRQHVP